jgi:hypothetical protein
MLLAAFLLPLLVSPSSKPLPTQAAALRGALEWTAGRGILVAGERPHELGPRAGRVPLAGPGHLELASAARATLRWPGLGSLRLEGPTSLAWQAGPPGEPLLLEFGSLTSTELEVRQGPVRVDLRGSWRLVLDSGAISLVALPGGGTELVHRAGRAARVAWVGGLDFAVPPRWLGPGQRLRLEGGYERPAPADPSAGARPWLDYAWPWAPGSSRPAPWRSWGWPWPAPTPGPQKPEPAPPRSGEPWDLWSWPWVTDAPGTRRT